MNVGRSNDTDSSTTIVPIIVGILVALVVGGFVISQFTDDIFPVQASAESRQIDQLFKIMLGIGGGLFLLVEGLLLYSIARFRAHSGDESDGPSIHGNVTLEIIWTAIPSVVVLALVIYSYQVWTDIREPKSDELVVEAIGARFAWTFNYYEPRLDCENTLVDPNLDCENRTINPNISSPILHTYAGRPVEIQMETNDVIHAFWVPAMRVKQDLLPGRRTTVRFTPIEAGEYRVVCTELCGSGHGNMFASIIVHEDEDQYLASFIDPAVDLVVNPPEDPVLIGGQSLASGAYPCSGCHMLNDSETGIEWAGITGPALNGIGDRAGGRVSGQSSEEYILASLYDTDAHLVAGYSNLMIQFQLDDPNGANYMPIDDASAIVAYLCTQTDTGESACDLENLAAYAESFAP